MYKRQIVNTGGYQGEILWEGQPVQIDSPRQAMNLGIGMVHQEFKMCIRDSCKIFYPLAYYAAFFSIRASAFSYEIMCQGRDKLEYYLADYKKRADTLSKNCLLYTSCWRSTAE